MLTNDQINSLKQVLIDEKDTLNMQIEGNNEEGYLKGSQNEATGELSSYDNHPADSATELFERTKNFAMDEHHEAQIEKIDQALQAIEAGKYGKCAECGAEIVFERLEVVPYTLYCVDHTPEQNQAQLRPAEEEILEQTHTTDFDRRQNAEMTDNRNSFNDVAQFGTSETPADFSGDKQDYNQLYKDSEEDEGFTEDFETFSATDIEGKNRKIVPNEKEAEYEAMLDDAGTDSQLGDIPYKEKDSYVEDPKKKDGDKEK